MWHRIKLAFKVLAEPDSAELFYQHQHHLKQMSRGPYVLISGPMKALIKDTTNEVNTLEIQSSKRFGTSDGVFVVVANCATLDARNNNLRSYYKEPGQEQANTYS